MTRRRRGTILAAAVALTLLFGNVALADHLKATCDLHVAASAKVEQGYVLTVHLHTSDGQPVNEDTVRFYQAVDFFGQREMLLGSAITDGQGNTSLTFLPARPGSYSIIARSTDKDHFTSAEGRTTFDATVAAPAYKAETIALSGFTKVVTAAVGAIVLAVWALIALALISTARGVRRGARDLSPKGDLA